MSTDVTILHPEFKPSYERYAHSIRIDALEDARDQVEQLFAVASERLKPAVILRVAYIDSFSSEDHLSSVGIEGLVFRGKALSVLEGIHRVIPYVATCGSGMEIVRPQRLRFSRSLLARCDQAASFGLRP